MAKEGVSDELTELMIEQKAMGITLKVLKKAFESGDINEEDYKDSKREYEGNLAKIKKEVESIKKSNGEVEEPKLESIEKEMSAKVEEATEKPDEDSGIKRGAFEPSLKSIEEEMSAKIVKVVKKPEVEVKKVRGGKDAPLEQIENEIHSLKKTYSILNVKKEVSESTLDRVKKNYGEGAIDESAYNRLRAKYENEVTDLSAKFEETNKKIEGREAIIPKYKELSKIRSDYKSKMITLEKEIAKNNKDLKFFKSRKLSIISNAVDYLSAILKEMRGEKKKLENSGINIPNASTPKKYAKVIKENNEILAELKATQEVLPTIIENLETKRNTDEMDNDTYLKMKSEYNTEKTKTDAEIKRVEEKTKRIEKELEIYNKMDKSIDSCRFIANAMSDSFRKIWLGDQIAELEAKTQDLLNQKRKLESEMEFRVNKMNKNLDELLGKIS